MTVSKRISKYLARQFTPGRWSLQSTSTEGVEQIVVVPSLAEDPGLFDTLEDLAANDPEEIAKTLVLVVVNNRELPHTTPEEVENNRSTLQKLADFRGDLRLAYVDASSKGKGLPAKEGVGLARKIGLDWGLSILSENGAALGSLISLDADTRVESNYLSAIAEAFEDADSWAAVVDYEHPVENPEIDERERAAIIQYELFLRYHELGLAYAGSPYAFPTIGSTMVCTGEAYAAISGMKQTQAGEDFYFLQALAKTGAVTRIRSTTVVPSSRPSHRVPFGTGRTVQRILNGEIEEVPFYHPNSYLVLKKWLDLVRSNPPDASAQLVESSERIDPSLSEFLRRQGFPEAWDRIQTHSKSPDRFLNQFHRWFDAFRTLKWIHWLRDKRYPNPPSNEAIEGLLVHAKDFLAPETQDRARRANSTPLEALGLFRRISRESPNRAGLGR